MRRGPRPGRLVSRGALAGVLLLGLAACMSPAEEDATPAEPGGTTGPTEEAPVTDVPVLQVRESGGYVLAGTDFRTVPRLTVYADGRAVSHGPQVAIYPPPALPNLRAHELSEESVDAFVTAASDAGLLDGAPDYGQPPLADVPATVVELHVDGETVRHEVEAFDVETVPWPLPDVALAELGECAVVQGDEALALGQELAGASTLTLFEQDGDLYEVWPRPLLPHETSCDDLPGALT